MIFKNLFDFMKNHEKWSAKIDFKIGEAIHLFKFEYLDDNVITNYAYLSIGHFGFRESYNIPKSNLYYPYSLFMSGEINHLDQFYYIRKENRIKKIKNQFMVCWFDELRFWEKRRLFPAAEFSSDIKKRLEDEIKLWMVKNI